MILMAWLIAAHHRSGFVAAGAEPTYWYPQGQGLPQSDIAVSYLRADDALPLEAARTLNNSSKDDPRLADPAREAHRETASK